MKKLLFLLSFSLTIGANAQLPDGSTAPDFTLVDWYGNTHNLYSYLNSGKTVFLKIFAAHCPSCWSYHQTHTLKDLYNQYGPNGTDEVMVLTLEHDQWNDTNAFIGNGPAWVTQGNWLDGTPYPIIDVEDPNRGVFTDYNVNFYPLVYKICPDKLTERVFTNETVSQLYQKAQNCPATLSIAEQLDLGKIWIDQLTKTLRIDHYEKVKTIKVVNLQGQAVKKINSVTSPTISINDLNTGIYLFEIQTENGPIVKKLYLN